MQPTTIEDGDTRHPVLVTRLVHADGTYTLTFHVACDRRGEAVPLDMCRDCPHCLEIAGESSRSWVRCSPAPALVPKPITVGDALEDGVLAVDEDLPIRDVVALFVERGLHFLVVTDSVGRVSGLVREAELVPHIRERAASSASGMAMGWQRTWEEPARNLMSSARCVHEATTLRHALGLMATRRDRQIVVVDAEGSPVGTLCDVEAMHILNSKTRYAAPA